MVAGIRDSTQQSQAPAEDEALKRNTDCVYFLASPLTCKKGSECEYRHSEYARVNPRDCWYWLNGNCLNPKCAFRHPPLDGFIGTQAVSSSGSSLPSSQAALAPAPPPAPAPAPAPHATYNQGKQAVPCIFFQKGLCLKGDKCAFLHGPNASSYSKSLPQVPAATAVAEPPTLKKPFGGLEKCNQEQKLPPANVSKSFLVPPEAKRAVKAETSQKIGVPIDKDVPTPTRFNDEVLSYKATSVPPVTNGNTMSRSNRIPQADVSDDQSFHNGKDADDLYRESSPGFDVLVDDELGDSEYYPDEDQFGRGGREGRNLNSVNEFDIGRSADYNSVADVDSEMFRDPRGYDSYERMHGQYAWEPRRASSERVLMGSAPLDRSYHKSESPDQINESDLRHHLSKHRRVKGLRSVISHDYALDNHNEERSYQGSRRDSHHLPLHESSLSSRLQGRIKLPGRSSLANGSDLCSEREMDQGRNFGRLSPGRPQFLSHQGRLRDRIKAKVQEDFNNEERNFSGPRMRRDLIDDRIADFASPKRLAELKVGKSDDSKEQQMKREPSFSLGKRKNLKVEGNQQSEGDLSFDGPKPLSEILKRKRVAETALSDSGTRGNKEGSQSVLIGRSKTLAATEMHTGFNSLSEKEASIHVGSIEEESKSATAHAVGRVEDGLIPTEKSELAHGKSSLVADISELETEDGMIVDEGIEDHDLEAFDHRDGDFDYEQIEGGDYNLDEGENADPEEEYLDEEDGDDFAKKIGVMFS